MECPSINNLSFSATSKKAIDTIRQKKKLADLLGKAIGMGSFTNIFLGNNTLNQLTQFIVMTLLL